MEEDGNNNIPDSISHYCDYLNSVVPKLHKTQRYNDIIQTSPMFFLVTFLAKNVSEWTTPPHWRRTGEVVYADDTALFLKAPRVAASDVQHLHLLLQLLGEATCLNTNISKSEQFDAKTSKC
jgi:aminoglycoside/choline kinase family phosphotransferase